MKLFKIRNIFDVPTMLNIIGIAVAVAAFYVIMSVVDFDLTYNHGITDTDQVYNLAISQDGGQPGTIISRPIGEEIGEKLPQVESFGCLNPWVDWSLYSQRNGEYNQLDIRTGKISKGLINTFGLKIVEGDTSRFNNPDKIIINRQKAESYGIHVGDMLKYDLNINDELEVVAIYDIAPNTELKPFGGLRCIGLENINDRGWSVTTYYYKVGGTLDEQVVKNTALEVFKKLYGISDEDENLNDILNYFQQKIKISLTPLSEIHFAPQMDGFHDPANPKIVYTLLILAIVIIVIAYINYVNFFFARVPQRIKSINTMKIFGSSRTNLIMILVGESLFLTMLSIALAFVLVHALAPKIVGGAIDMDIVYSNYKILIISIIIPIITSIAVSIYPAMHITNISPALALKGNVTETHDSKLRYIMIGFQITASTMLIIASLFIHQNTEYVVNNDLGFNSQNLLGVEISKRITQKPEEVRSILLQNPDITDITWSRGSFVARLRHNIGFNNPDNPEMILNTDVYFVADNFLNFMEIPIVEGRDFITSDKQGEKGVYIVNETFKNLYNYSLENKIINSTGNGYCDIVGICKDFKFKPLLYEISPFVFFVTRDTTYYSDFQHLYIRIAKNANVSKTMKYIKKSLAEIDPDFEYMNHEIKTFQRETLDENYSAETNLTRMITLFAIIAILISVMGIFGIVYFETQRRRKEIGIRRVNGATISEILLLFNRKFFILTSICSAIAIPTALILVQKYFSGFAYHYPINAWIFAIGIIITIAITILVVTLASVRAAHENPINTLKND